MEMERVRLLPDGYFIPPEYTEGADHPLQFPHRVEVEGYPYVHGGRRGMIRPFGLI